MFTLLQVELERKAVSGMKIKEKLKKSYVVAETALLECMQVQSENVRM